MSVRNGDRLVKDGPFAETKEIVAGYYVVDCATLDQAIDAAARIPSARFGASRCARSRRCEHAAAAAARGHRLALPGVVRPGRRCPRAQRRRSRSRRGVRPGRVRDGGRALAARRAAGRSGSLDHPRGAQPRDRPPAPAAAWRPSASARPWSSRRCGARSSPSATRRSRRAARADVRLLPPVTGARGERRAHAAARRADSRSRRSPARCSRRRRRSRSDSCAPSARCARVA